MKIFNRKNEIGPGTSYSIDLPKGIYTDILNDFYMSRKTVLANHEMIGRYAGVILQDDLDKCMGYMNLLINQRIHGAREEKLKLQQKIDFIKCELSQPVKFEDKAEKEPSIIREFIKHKKRYFRKKSRRTS